MVYAFQQTVHHIWNFENGENMKIKSNSPNSVAENNGEAKECPWQVWSQEIQNTKKVHSNKWVSSRPYVYEHYCKRLSKEQQINEKGENLEKRQLVIELFSLFIKSYYKLFWLTIISAPPKMNIMMKSELLPRNEPSSSIRQ